MAGGGTAGHLMPGLAVAEALVAQGWPADMVHFVGSARGIDSRVVPEAGFGLTVMSGRGLNRSTRSGRRPDVANLAANAVSAARLGWACVRGAALIGRRRPAAVLSLGGYASLPAALGAVVWRVPLVIAEQNAVASDVNRLLSRFARAAAVPVRGTGLRSEVVTGTPVRVSVYAAAQQREQVRRRHGWDDSTVVVVVFGGSLGSRRINTAVWGAMSTLVQRKGLAMYHVVGRRDWDERPSHGGEEHVRPADGAASPWYTAVEYDDDLPRVLAAADFAVCRAGASTVAELDALGCPAILVPLPIAARDHQRANADMFASAHAAAVVRDEELDSARLIREIDLFAHMIRAQRVSGGRQPTRPAQPGQLDQPTQPARPAAERIAALLIEHSRSVPEGVTQPERLQ